MAKNDIHVFHLKFEFFKIALLKNKLGKIKKKDKKKKTEVLIAIRP